MPVGSLDAVTIDCNDPNLMAAFWAAVFGTGIDTIEGEPAHYIDLLPAAGAPTLRMQRVPEPKTVKDRIHIDVMVDNLELAMKQVQGLGAAAADGVEFAEYGVRFRVMLDPEGNEFCLVCKDD